MGHFCLPGGKGEQGIHLLKERGIESCLEEELRRRNKKWYMRTGVWKRVEGGCRGGKCWVVARGKRRKKERINKKGKEKKLAILWSRGRRK